MVRTKGHTMHTHHYKKNGTISKSDWIKIRRFAVALVESNLSLFSSVKINQDIIHLKPKKKEEDFLKRSTLIDN